MAGDPERGSVAPRRRGVCLCSGCREIDRVSTAKRQTACSGLERAWLTV